jgi:hypothetical protein
MTPLSPAADRGASARHLSDKSALPAGVEAATAYPEPTLAGT